MGMFDTVFVEVDLPDGFKAESFQTKDFECSLDYFKISEDGKLLFQDYSYEEIPEEERASLKFDYKYRRVDKGWFEWHTRRGTLFHGEFNFYTSGPEPEREWHEYIAKFNNGQLEEIIIDQHMNDFYRNISKKKDIDV